MVLTSQIGLPKRSKPKREMAIGLVGNNLLNENIRNSVSYTKDQVLLPDIGVRAFANLKF
ncbi:hypothetical protein CWO90_44020 [Bradyrhizobium sp. Leo121]|nr:hypothetical protein CWO90_44020 [Bradyrhizobium sp. Leo121]